MKLSRIINVILFSAIAFSVSAQRHRTETIVLKDGTMIAGRVIADSSGSLVFKIKRPRIIILEKSQILTTGITRPGHLLSPDKHGYYMNLSASVLTGRSSDGNSGGMSIRLSNGYQFKNGLSLGIGTGIEELDVLMIPVYADIRFHPFKTKVSPYIWAAGGYGFPGSDRKSGRYYYYDYYGKTKGGMMLSAGTGIALYSWNRSAISMGVGYRYQRLKSVASYSWRETTNELLTNFNRIEVLIGFIFR